VTDGGAEAAVGGVDGGFRVVPELEVPAPLAALPAGTVAVVAPVLGVAWCPGRALAT
jgi:hypothetical protein